MNEPVFDARVFKYRSSTNSSQMGVEPKIGGKPPKWMVKIMENPMNKWMIWGETPLFLETPIYIYIYIYSPNSTPLGSMYGILS